MYEHEDGGSRIKVGIQENGFLFASDSVDVFMAVKFNQGEGSMVRIGPDGMFSLEPYENSLVTSPTMRLPRDFAMALMNGLIRHFQGAEDTRTLRGDLLHERSRVDKMITALIDSNHRLLSDG